MNFELQTPEVIVEEELTLATAIAASLGNRLSAVISAQECSSNTPFVVGVASPGAAITPVQTGTFSVYATVTIQVGFSQ